MEIETRTVGSVTIFSLAGRFDAFTAPAVADTLAIATMVPPACVVVNLEKVTFVDSTARAALVQGMKRTREHTGDLKLCGLQQPVRIIFELTRLDKAFEIFSDADQAARSFAA